MGLPTVVVVQTLVIRSRLRRFGAARPLAGVVAVVGVLASWVAAGALAAGQRDHAEQQLTRRTSLVQAAAAAETGRYVDTLRTVAAAAGAVDTLTAAKFDQVTASLAGMRLAGASSVVYLVPADTGEVAATQAWWRGRGAAGLVLKPAPGAREHIFTIFSRALDGATVRRAGIDAGRAAAPARALATARRTGQVTVSDAYQLLIDHSLPAERRQMSFSLAAPVFGMPDGTGRRSFRGWVLMGLRGQDFLGGTLAEASQGLLDVTLSAEDVGGRAVTVAALRASVDGRRDLSGTATVAVADHGWRLHVAAYGPALPGGLTRTPTLVAAAGSLLAVLLAGLVYLLATARSRAEAQVGAATAELSAAEARARDQATLLESIMNSISDGVGVVDEHGEFLLHNPAAKAMLGIDQDQGGADNWQAHYGIFLPDGHTPFPTGELPLVQALAGRPTEQVEMVIRNAGRPDGIPLSVSGRPLHDQAGRAGAVAVFHDITDRKAAEARLDAMIAELRDREADLRAFAGVAAHDLKSPLTAVAGFAELLEDSLVAGADPAALRPTAARIVAGVGRMGRLIDDLLAYATARDGQLHQEPVDLTGLVREVITERTAHLRGGTEDGRAALFPDIYTGPLPVTLADPAMVRQLLDNLIGNALKYTLPGQPARIDISAHARSGDEGWVRVEIADRGIGIPDRAAV